MHSALIRGVVVFTSLASVVLLSGATCDAILGAVEPSDNENTLNDDAAADHDDGAGDDENDRGAGDDGDGAGDDENDNVGDDPERDPPGPPPSFMGLGDLPEGEFGSGASAVSDDGLTIVGSATTTTDVTYDGRIAFLWRNGVMSALATGGYAPSQYSSHATALSADGALVFGSGRVGPDVVAMRWAGGEFSIAVWIGISQGVAGASADGGTLVGQVLGYGASTYAYASIAGGVSQIGYDYDLDGSILVESSARDVSDDGVLAVGYAKTQTSERQAVIWTLGTGVTTLPGMPDNTVASEATAISGDGSVIAGAVYDGTVWRTFVWTEAGGAVVIDDLPGGTAICTPQALTRDGSLFVGSANTGGPDERAVIWHPVAGLRDLGDVLVDDFGLDLTGWTLQSATDITRDGSVIVGYGINPDGRGEAWRAALR